MPGMLTQGQNPNPSPGPGPQTPPVGNPGAGTPLPSSASGSGQPPPQQAQGGLPGNPPERQPADASFEELRDQGIQQLYGENFDGMIEMFQSNGPQKFPRSMAVAVNSTLEYLEQQHGSLSHEQAAEVGMDIMMKLLEDIIGGGVLPDVTLEQVQQAFPAILVMYADARPDVTKADIQALAQEVARGVQQHEGQQPGAAPPMDPRQPLSTGPGPEPSGSPVPPGAM